MFAVLLLLQTGLSAPPPSAAPPDFQLDIRATARRVVIENDGRVDLRIRTSANGREGEGNVIDVAAPTVPPGRSELDNVEVRVRAEARIPDPLGASSEPQEPPPPQ